MGLVKASPGFELVTEPSLALLVFRLNPSVEHLTDPELNLLNQQLHTRLNARYDVFLTQTILHGIEREIFCIRFAMGGVNTTMEDVKTTWEVVRLEGEQVLRDWRATQAV